MLVWSSAFVSYLYSVCVCVVFISAIVVTSYSGNFDCCHRRLRTLPDLFNLNIFIPRMSESRESRRISARPFSALSYALNYSMKDDKLELGARGTRAMSNIWEADTCIVVNCGLTNPIQTLLCVWRAKDLKKFLRMLLLSFLNLFK